MYIYLFVDLFFVCNICVHMYSRCMHFYTPIYIHIYIQVQVACVCTYVYAHTDCINHHKPRSTYIVRTTRVHHLDRIYIYICIYIVCVQKRFACYMCTFNEYTHCIPLQ